MSVEFEPETVSSGYNLSKINDNFEAVATALEDAVSRSGNAPNNMLVDLDLDSNDILNVDSLDTQNLTVGGVEISAAFSDTLEARDEAVAAAEVASANAELTDLIGAVEDASVFADASEASSLVAQASAATAAAVGGGIGAEFNALAYIRLQTGGDEAADKLIAYDDTVDASVVTAGIQAAVVAWYETGQSGVIIMPAGRWRLNGPITAGLSGGVSVAEHISDGDLGAGSTNMPMYLTIKGEGMATEIVVDGTFVDPETRWIDRAVFRFEQQARRITGPYLDGLTFLWDGDEADEWLCPTAIKVTRVNQALIKNIVVRSTRSAEVYPAMGIHAEAVNNSSFGFTKLKAGNTPMEWEASNEAVLGMTLDADGKTVTDADGLNGFADAVVGDHILLGGAANDVADIHIGVIGAKTSDNVVELDSATELGATTERTGMCVGGALPIIHMNAGQFRVRADKAIFTSDMVGRMIHVVGTAPEESTELGIISGYIKLPNPFDGTEVLIYEADGTTAVRCDVTFSGGTLVMTPSFFLGQSQEFAGEGHNNDVHLYGVHSEKGEGGAQFLIQQGNGIFAQGGKSHGRSTTNLPYDMNFTKSGYLYLLDNNDTMTFESVLLTWANVVDTATDRGLGISLVGTLNYVTFNNYQWYGLSNKIDLLHTSHSKGSSHHVVMGNGFMLGNNWAEGDNDHQVMQSGTGTLSPINTISTSGTFVDKSSGTSLGPTDLLAKYKNLRPVKSREILSGVISVDGSGIYEVDTEGSVASDYLTLIENALEGTVVTITPPTTGRIIVIEHSASTVDGVQTVDSGNITLDASRESVSLYRGENYWRELANPV